LYVVFSKVELQPHFPFAMLLMSTIYGCLAPRIAFGFMSCPSGKVNDLCGFAVEADHKKRAQSVPLVARTDREGDQKPPSPPASLTGRFQHCLLTTSLWMIRAVRPSPPSCWVQCLFQGNDQLCQSCLLAQNLADPGAGESLKPHVGHHLGWQRVSAGGGCKRRRVMWGQ